MSEYEKSLYQIIEEGESIELRFHDFVQERVMKNKTTGKEFTKYQFRFLNDKDEFVHHLASFYEAKTNQKGIALEEMEPDQKLKATRTKYGYEWQTIFTPSLAQ